MRVQVHAHVLSFFNWIFNEKKARNENETRLFHKNSHKNWNVWESKFRWLTPNPLKFYAGQTTYNFGPNITKLVISIPCYQIIMCGYVFGSPQF